MSNSRFKFRAWGAQGVMRSWDDLQSFHVSTLFTMCQPEVKLMQWTGLTDKNGVDIYEGDLVSVREKKSRAWSSEPAKVVFSHGYVGGWVLTVYGTAHLNMGTRTDCLLVVGNIHENPELMEINQ